MSPSVQDARRLDAIRMLDAQDKDAWYTYFTSTKNLEGPRYDEIEPWAWKQLQTSLKATRARRKKLVA